MRGHGRTRDLDRPHILYLLHNAPEELGGTEKHVAVLREALSDTFDFSTLYPGRAGYVLRAHWAGRNDTLVEFLLSGRDPRSMDIENPDAAFALRTALDMFDFDAVHIQNIIGHSLVPMSVLEGFQGPVVYSLRDQFLACPHHWLLYRNERACGVPRDHAVCATCLPLTKDLRIGHLAEHRRYVQDHLGRFDHIVVASENAADYLLRAYEVEQDRFKLIEHGTLLPLEDRISEVDVDHLWHEPLRIAFAGQGRKKKGIDIVEWLAVELRDDDIEVHHFGQAYDETTPDVVTHGRYDNRWLPALLDMAGIHAVLLPGQYAETFGHVMTEALLAGKPVIGADYGALAERIYKYQSGWTINPDDPSTIATLIRDLDRDRAELERVTRRVRAVPLCHTKETAPEYAKLYFAGGRTAARKSAMSEREERLRRELRALAELNREIQLGGAPKPVARGELTREIGRLEKILRSREREIADLKEAYARSRKRAREAEQRHARFQKRAREAEQRYESVMARRSVRLALKLAERIGRLRRRFD